MGNQEIGGRWTDAETTNHINILELQAAFFALKAFCHTTCNTHVQSQIDNTTAVAYITNMGGSTSTQLNNLAKEMWTWCINKNIWVSAVHIAGKLNTSAHKHFSQGISGMLLLMKMIQHVCQGNCKRFCSLSLN